ncbi:CsgG/HfaB family protein [Glaciimonas sp. PCH181]|uniref:CsgG/HfaB family protein n=1 Tax=Glaciimonas sp. PCH181 TaxID=2133943 RepID=UPI001374CA6C|nr:CsgG/HfaB family protein [Glaciimonas sp. PCH181]
MKLPEILCAAGLILSVAACSNDEAPAQPEAASASAQVAAAPAPTAPTNAMPDAGKLTSVATTATGIGPSPADAVDEAIKLAIKQVNGVTLDMSSEQFRSVLAVALGRDSAQLQAKAFSDHVAQQSNGVVTSFKITKMEEPFLKGSLSFITGGQFKATIEANIAKFDAPADTKKLKIVVGPIRFDAQSFKVAGAAVPSEKVASEIRQKILDALTNTGRFAVLDRELGGDIQSELDMISAGQAPAAELSKMRQSVSADLIWTAKIDAFSYQNKQGNWALSQRIINVATRQVQLSSVLQGNVSNPQADSQGADSAVQTLETGMVSSVVSAILMRTFPITVASRDGNNVVLSQGGQSVREGMRYQLVSMGAEIKDPQTGQSLGRTEYDCCEVVVDKVGPTMAQGRLENIRMPLEQIQPGGLQLRNLSVAKAADAPEKTATGTTGKKPVARKKEVDIFASDKSKW